MKRKRVIEDKTRINGVIIKKCQEDKAIISGKIHTNEKVNLHLSASSVGFDNLKVGENAVFTLDVHQKSPASALEEFTGKSASKIIDKVITSRIGLFAPSTKIRFQFGKNTFATAYTPDSDGITRTENGEVTCKKNGLFFHHEAVDGWEQMHDVNSARMCPKKDFKVMKGFKLRTKAVNLV